jgi:hypothetical protein
MVEDKEIDIGSGSVFGQVKSFCYLGDAISAGGGAEDASRSKEQMGEIS